MIGALSMLQRQQGDADVDLKPVLAQTLQRQSGEVRALGRPEDDTIDIVEMLFDAILDDPHLARSIKALIGRLQIPVIKVALLDRAFFGKRKHPARALINELAQAALGWSEPTHVERDPLYRQVEYTVDRILREFSDDIGLFEELLQEFRQFCAEERERTRLIEERTRQAAEGKAKVDVAKSLVDSELHVRLGMHNPPEVVKVLLKEAWAKVLFITCLREGGDSDVFQRQLEVVDRLLWSLEPKATAEERKELLGEIPGLLHDLREGLNGILYNPFEMARLFKALETEHVRCLTASGQPGSGAVADSAATIRPAPEEDKPTAGADTEAVVDEAEPSLPDSQTSENLQRLRDVTIGTWFEFVHDNGSRVRAKLSAKLNEGERLIFVNRAGFKMADRTLPEMAADLETERAFILDDNMLFDKALEAVVSNLRDMRADR
ncbi:DUF1631 family protein [Alkalilimnicola ehrlichii]|uniref:DUF1631 family protein n=1 Tax=Alkalilimnicola ehrlichii TaxID=351052 RepID=UPI0015F26DCD|nr:DUF1631 family protein [Alkalilimnicola ehrlichii]